MFGNETTEFSGIGGRVLRQSFSVLSLINGVIIGIILLVGTWFMMQWGEERLATLYSQAIVALALARFALNGLAGEWNGTIVSTAGGSWIMVGQVALRYMTLSALWVVPLLLLGLNFEAAGEEMGSLMLGAGGGLKITLAALYLLGLIMTPPIFLISSVSAETFRDLFTTAHWGRLFKGRLGDLYFIYVVYIGGVLTAIGLMTPVMVIGFTADPDAGIFVLGLVLLFIGGLALSLMGRLCGFYAFGESGPAQFSPSARLPADAPATPSAMKPRVAPPPAARPGPVNSTTSPSGARYAAPAAAGSSVSGGTAPAPASAKPVTPSGKPALMDAKGRVDEAWRRFTEDPQGAISVLRELRTTHAPNPPILQALCLMYTKASQPGFAIEIAKEILPLYFERGHIGPATEIFRALISNYTQLSLTRDQILAIAANLLKTGEANVAAQTFGAVLRSDTGERRAIKGLLQVADLKLQDPAGVAAAVKIYKFLLQHCSSSPLAEDMRRGLDEAERRLARAPARS